MISRHPDDALLLSYANATLDAASAIVVGAHLEACAHCRRTLQALDALGGDLLERLPPHELQAGAFERVLARLEADIAGADRAPHATGTSPVAPHGARSDLPTDTRTDTRAAARSDTRSGTRSSRPATRRPDVPAGMRWPRSLDGCEIGPWRRIGPGMRWTRVGVPEQPDANVVLLRMAAGRELAAHTHEGIELTQLLHGAFDDGRTVWRAGDLDQTDEHIHHHPVVMPDDECICLVALHGRVRFDGWIARRLGAWMGI